MEVNFDKRLLSIIVCPKTHTKLVLDEEKNELISRAGGLAFPIRNGIPILLIDQAREIQENS
ncbi:MAG: Trm112 family protein [Paracoccaceae bacterium]